MPKGIPNKKPAPEVAPDIQPVPGSMIDVTEADEDAELARLIAEDEAEKAKSEAALQATAEARAEQARTFEAKAVLIDQANTLDLAVDDDWSVETLAEKVIEAQEAKKAADQAKFDAAKGVWVYLLRAAYPVEDKKCFAGETIEVTPEIADKWFEAGVARPGRKPV